MKRLATFVGLLLIVPAFAAAQMAPPAPPAPPAAPAPMVAPVPPVPQAPPAPPAPARVLMPPVWDAIAVEDAMRAVRMVDMDQVREANAQAREAAAQAREAVRVDQDHIREMAREAAAQANRFSYDYRFDEHVGMMPMTWSMSSQGEGGNYYDSGKSSLNSGQWDRAITYFDRTIAAKSPYADGALYWKAYAQWKLAKTEDALATIGVLRKEHPQSRYLGDAKVLEQDVRRSSGQPVNPDAIKEEEIKLLAISAVGKSENGVTIVEGVLNGSNSLNLKKRALYVLATSEDQTRAYPILLRYAKGAGNPDLQYEAIRYIASRRDGQTTAKDLQDIYNSTTDARIRMAIINAFQSSQNKNALVAIAGSTSNTVDVRRAAVNGLSNLAAPQELWALYQKETDNELKMQMISVFSSMGAIDQLEQIVKTEKDPTVRARAIRSLGNQKSERTGQTLVGIYSSDQDANVRNAVITALGNQNNAEGLVGIARKEQNTELKLKIVNRLAEMARTSKVAADYLAELIK
ncbi:MAG TPA: HEAT repeat domain-containing protein [Vicinamibacterales bacterium]|nr:HEAT repeat domain-containing protein [Vicinamibacterales bacterium]